MGLRKTLVICLAVVNLVWSLSEGREFSVGNHKASWQIPSPSDSFDKWAQRYRFQIGDSIVFKYNGKTDSVVEVGEADYKTCNKSNPIKSYNDGNTKITLEKSGLFYFISGVEEHCHKGQKVEVRVLGAIHHHHHSPAPAPAHHNSAATIPVGFLGALVLALIIALV